MKELRGLDLKRAQLVPSSVFASPEEVVRHKGLSLAQKLAILRRWEFDARRIAGYAGGHRSAEDMGLLFRVRRALQSLTFRDVGRVPADRRSLTVPLDREVVVPAPVMASPNATGKF